ncbi:chorismate mutase [Parasphingorhabdus sp.]|jgi:isochorismate pyruvate lyase|uniref:chorismate mutase n=1 Tax=Parasphingorhabdus sp. TaxID=2709688 RepID=UPI0026D7ADD9
MLDSPSARDYVAAMTDIAPLPPMENMADVRENVDRLDATLIALFAQRFECMDAAARIKQDRNIVRDEVRKAAVLAHVKQRAAEAGIPVPTMAAMWEMLVETSISYELQKWDQLREE